jgi:hypothetical protein
MPRSIQNIIRTTSHYESTTGISPAYLTLNITIRILSIYTYFLRIVEIIFVYRSSKTCNALLHCCTKLRPTFPSSYLLTPRSRIILEKLTGSQLLKNFPHFMEPEVSLPHSQVPVTCPYPQPDRSSPCYPAQLPEDLPQYYPPIYARVFQVAFFPQVSPPKPCIHLYSTPYVLHAPPI